jgi:hypothetical protein
MTSLIQGRGNISRTSQPNCMKFKTEQYEVWNGNIFKLQRNYIVQSFRQYDSVVLEIL